MSSRQIAIMTFNSLTHASISGFRGSAQTQQILFEAENVSIHVRVSAPDERRIVMGQLLQSSPAGFIQDAKVTLTCQDAAAGSVATNALGEFRFDQVSAGPAVLEIEIAGRPSIVANFKVIGD